MLLIKQPTKMYYSKKGLILQVRSRISLKQMQLGEKPSNKFSFLLINMLRPQVIIPDHELHKVLTETSWLFKTESDVEVKK